MKAVDGSAARWGAAVLASAAIVVAVAACRSGAQVPKDLVLPVIQPTVSRDICFNDRYPPDAPQFGDNSAIGYVFQPSGLKVFDRIVGSGGTPPAGSIVTVRYTGWLLENGCIFDSSYIQDVPGEFPLDQLMTGWAEGVSSMQAGGRRRLEIPPELAYGAFGIPGVIPANATLVFEIELVSFAQATPTPEPEAAPSATPTP